MPHSVAFPRVGLILRRVTVATVCCGLAALRAADGTLAPIDTSGFNDATHHWRAIKEPERVMQMVPNQPSYKPEQVREIAANILLFQRANGGWPKDYDMLAILNEEQKQALRDSHTRTDATFDNHTTHTQVDYLARAAVLTGEAAHRDACGRGLGFMLASQYPMADSRSGGRRPARSRSGSPSTTA
jgi:hypothetical protein